MSTSGKMADLSLQIARRHVEIYAHQYKDLMAQHREALECRACEEFLHAGIEAYRWLKRADRTIREAARQGLDVPDEAVESLRVLFRAWLRPCRNAFMQIKSQNAKGFSVGNSGEFQTAYDYVRSYVQRQKDYAILDGVMQGDAFGVDFWNEAARLRGERTGAEA